VRATPHRVGLRCRGREGVRSVPRRPKLGETGNVLMKVNEQLFDMAFDLSEAGIPVFAGVPVVSFACAASADV